MSDTETTEAVAAHAAGILAWLRENQPEEVELWNGPASADAIRAAELALGRALPEDYKAFLAIHDGQSNDTAAFVEGPSLMRVEDLAEQHQRLIHLIEDGDPDMDKDEVDPEVQPLWFSPEWIPIARSARGRDFLCLDFAPTKKGRVGQVILMVIDFDERTLVANSFTELLARFVQDAEEGEIHFIR